MKKITLPALVSHIETMIREHSRYPVESWIKSYLTNGHAPTVAIVDSLPVRSVILTHDQTSDGSEREIRYSFVDSEEWRQYFLHA